VDLAADRPTDRAALAVRLTQPSVWRLLRALGWSVQRPTGQARQRDKAE